jgi:hypothetical protein
MLVFLLGDHIPCRIRTTNKQTKQSRLCSVQRRPYLYGYLVLIRYVAHPISALPILLLSGCVVSFHLFAWHELQHVLSAILIFFLLQLIMVIQHLENSFCWIQMPTTWLLWCKVIKWLWIEKDIDVIRRVFRLEGLSKTVGNTCQMCSHHGNTQAHNFPNVKQSADRCIAWFYAIIQCCKLNSPKFIILHGLLKSFPEPFCSIVSCHLPHGSLC